MVAVRTDYKLAFIKSASSTMQKAKPFLKWAGGKGQLLPELLKLLPPKFASYHEPFIGGGALFFRLLPEQSFLSDSNPELINVYQVVKDHCQELLNSLQYHQNTVEYYYFIRGCDPAKLDPITRASRFIYLNKTCYNGLYRVNRSGKFNVPFGRYQKPRYADETGLLTASRALRNARITLADFEITRERAQKGDFVYFDPPYQPLSKTANFTSYTSDSFDENSQARLADLYRELDRRGCYLMLSNSESSLVRELYKDFRQEKVMAKRYINRVAEGRGHIPEIIVLNY